MVLMVEMVGWRSSKPKAESEDKLKAKGQRMREDGRKDVRNREDKKIRRLGQKDLGIEGFMEDGDRSRKSGTPINL